jgi:hypothetical protein
MLSSTPPLTAPGPYIYRHRYTAFCFNSRPQTLGGVSYTYIYIYVYIYIIVYRHIYDVLANFLPAAMLQSINGAGSTYTSTSSIHTHTHKHTLSHTQTHTHRRTLTHTRQKSLYVYINIYAGVMLRRTLIEH